MIFTQKSTFSFKKRTCFFQASATMSQARPMVPAPIRVYTMGFKVRHRLEKRLVPLDA